MELKEKLIACGYNETAADRVADLIPGASGQVVTFDFDNTCVLGDLGEMYAHYLARSANYAFSDERFWDQLVTPHLEKLKNVASEVGDHPIDHAEYERFVGELNGLYFRKLARDGKRAAFQWAVTLHAGMTESEMAHASEQCISEEIKTVRCVETWPTFDDTTVSFERGIRPFQSTHVIMDALKDCGAEIWLVSASNEWTIRQAAVQLFGLDPTQVIGNRVEMIDQTLTNIPVNPSLYREGKVEAIKARIGRTPFLAFGDTDTDLEMLMYASNAVFLDRGNEELLRIATENDWIVTRQSDLGVTC